MTEPASPVRWLPDGSPHNIRFDDRYRGDGDDGLGGIAQARHVFLGGCGLPEAWRGADRWTVLETGFGLGLNFLATWQAWRTDPQAPRHLHYVAVEAWPPAATDLLRSVAPFPELAPLAQKLCDQWDGLLPGFHRLAFDGGRLQLTLCIGDARAMLRELRFEADSVFLDGFDPGTNPDMWDVYTLKAVSHLCRRGTRLATWTIARSVRDALAQSGFIVEKAPGLPPKRDCLRGRWDPRWTPRRPADLPGATSSPASTGSGPAGSPSARRTSSDLGAVAAPRRTALVIGGGLAGASTAFSLALRGWRVTVVDQDAEPAAGASGLPAGLVAPHVSADDRALSSLTRSGVRATLARAGELLRDGVDWQPSGVLEHRVKDGRDLPPDWLLPNSPGQYWSRPATAEQLVQAGLGSEHHAHWHARAGWIRPAALVRAMLAQPDITWRGATSVARLERIGESWRALDADDSILAQADLAIVAAGYDTRALLESLGAPRLPLNALRGQITWGPLPDGADALPPFPVNGSGSLISGLDIEGRPAWIFGSTFERGCAEALVRPEDTLVNFDKLATLLPAVAAALRPQFNRGETRAWAAVRCTAPDRLPIVGPVDPVAWPGLWACTAMGARGITLAVLCAELLAAQLHGEPLAVPLKQMRALSPQRWAPVA